MGERAKIMHPLPTPKEVAESLVLHHRILPESWKPLVMAMLESALTMRDRQWNDRAQERLAVVQNELAEARSELERLSYPQK